MVFTPHPTLAADTAVAADLPLSRALLMKDARFPWIILVPRQENLTELFDLNNADQQQLLHEISCVAQLLKQTESADKMNIAMLGNQVPQLHVHIIARFKNDAAWPNPVWGNGEKKTYDEKTLQARIMTYQKLFEGIR